MRLSVPGQGETAQGVSEFSIHGSEKQQISFCIS